MHVKLAPEQVTSPIRFSGERSPGIFTLLEVHRVMTHSYETKGVCSRRIDVTIEDGIVKDVKFTGGCNGNTKGIAALAVGFPAQEIAEKLKGIRCGARSTSCPEQLAFAIEQALAGSTK